MRSLWDPVISLEDFAFFLFFLGSLMFILFMERMDRKLIICTRLTASYSSLTQWKTKCCILNHYSFLALIVTGVFLVSTELQQLIILSG